jgi:arylsulfatase
MEFTKEKTGKHGESHGHTKLYINDKVVAEGSMRTQIGKFTLCGDGLCIGYDSADAVAAEYTPETQGKFTGGKIQYVEVSVEKEQYRDLEKEMAAAMAVD